MSLDQVLTGAPENTAEPTDDPVEIVEQPQTDEPVVEPEKVEKPAEPTPAKPEQTVPLQALQDERRKRQELEQRLAQQQPQKPNFWEKPEEHLDSVRQEAQIASLTVKLDLTEDAARSKYTDFDEKFETFKGLVAANPNLRQQMLQARNPAEFMYSTAKNHAELQAAGSIEGLREKMKAQIRAEVEAEVKAKSEAEAKRRDALPNTLTDVQTAAPRAAEFTGPTPLDAILK